MNTLTSILLALLAVSVLVSLWAWVVDRFGRADAAEAYDQEKLPYRS